ncbi:hypothetical protein K438DRAFT_178751 [Mycena galopus ATCC 62051]|nr:hypothetical protein K438DRAFT_178751 [Mycena galopus ATCC 62051]
MVLGDTQTHLCRCEHRCMFVLVSLWCWKLCKPIYCHHADVFCFSVCREAILTHVCAHLVRCPHCMAMVCTGVARLNWTRQCRHRCGASLYK